jgi:hypothetical protein
MITITCRPVEGSRSKAGISYLATTTIAGKSYSASSRHGAPFALARELVAQGIPDDEVIVRSEGAADAITYRPLHHMAELTIVESATVPVRAAKYRKFDQNAVTGEQGMGSSDVGALSVPSGSDDAPATLRLSVTDPICETCRMPFVPKRSTARFCSTRCRMVAHRKAAA